MPFYGMLDTPGGVGNGRRSQNPLWVIRSTKGGMCLAMIGSFDKVKLYVGWDIADRDRLATLRHCLDSELGEVVETLGRQLVRFKGTQPLMTNAHFVRRLHDVLRDWLMGPLGGTFDDEYVKDRLAFGRELVAAGLAFEDVILLEELARTQLFDSVRRRFGENHQVLSSVMRTLGKAFSLDLELIYSAYHDVRDAQMERALLDRFLSVTGFSRTLYENLAEARERREGGSHNR